MSDLTIVFLSLTVFAGLGFCAFVLWLIHRERVAQINKDRRP